MMIKDFHKTAIITSDHEVSYSEMIQHINEYAESSPKEHGAKTIIFSENSEEWIYAFFAIWQNDGIAVPVDASSTSEDLAYIVNDCDPQCIWTSTANESKVNSLEAVKSGKLKVLNLSAPQKPSETQKPSALNPLPFVPFSEARLLSLSKEEEVALIIYTSGTTGSPKGVMLTYENLFANINGVSKEVPIYNDKRRVMILLPLHHVLPLMGCLIAPIRLGAGVAICPTMTGGDIMATLQRGKVSIIIGVPRLWETLYRGIKKKIDERAATRAAFYLCAKAKNRTLSRTVFKKIHEMMGGNLDFCVSGGAALNKEIAEGLRTLGLDVLEGYGMTETAPIIAFTRPDDIIPGCVGKPLPSMECKLIEGELCAKGPNVMKGYYNRPEETAAVIDKEGFIHTGDLARFDQEGRVYITGRKKEIIVLSNGKNVQPAEIEYKLEKYDKYVKECAVTEKDDKLLAIIVPQDSTRSLETSVEQTLKREVIEPYNLTVENYKKIMQIVVYHGELPRTKLDKIQRFKLKALVESQQKSERVKELNSEKVGRTEPSPHAVEESGLGAEFLILRDYIQAEKHLPVLPTSHIETDLAFDSLDRVGLQGFIEQTFGMELNADEMSSFPNVQAIADHIAHLKTKQEVEDIDWQKILHIGMPSIKLPSTSRMYTTYAATFRKYLQKHNSLTINGADNIPAKGPFIIAPNHQSFIDGAIAMAGMPKTLISECYFYATEEHVQGFAAKYMASHNNIILMETKNLKASILKLAEVLKRGKNIIIFPEGSRTWDGSVGQFKKTFAILAKELQCPIVPVCIRGAFEAMPRGSKTIKPTKIEVEYLSPILPTAADSYDAIAENVRTVISQKLIQNKI